MPAVLIRLLDNIAVVAMSTTSQTQRDVLLRQANMVLRSADASVDEEIDLADIRTSYARAHDCLTRQDDDVR